MIGWAGRWNDNAAGVPRCIHLSASLSPFERPSGGPGEAGRSRAAAARRGRPGQTDAALSTSSSRPAPHCLTADPGHRMWPWSPIAASFEESPRADGRSRLQHRAAALAFVRRDQCRRLHPHCTGGRGAADRVRRPTPESERRPGSEDLGRRRSEWLGGARRRQQVAGGRRRRGRGRRGRGRRRGGRRDANRRGRRGRRVAGDGRATERGCEGEGEQGSLQHETGVPP